MKLSNIILLLFISVQLYGQNNTFYKTTGKKNLHYLEFDNEKIIVYKMGVYFDKGGSGSAIILTDTLLKNIDNNFFPLLVFFTNKHDERG